MYILCGFAARNALRSSLGTDWVLGLVPYPVGTNCNGSALLSLHFFSHSATITRTKGVRAHGQVDSGSCG
jgi:hypothetical protein